MRLSVRSREYETHNNEILGQSWKSDLALLQQMLCSPPASNAGSLPAFSVPACKKCHSSTIQLEILSLYDKIPPPDPLRRNCGRLRPFNRLYDYNEPDYRYFSRKLQRAGLQAKECIRG